MNLPNLITLLRLVMAPAVVWLILDGQSAAAFWLFIAAGVSDALDGLIAKRFDQTTQLGAYLDPVADKALLVGIYVTLGISGELPAWLVLLVVSRDMLIVGGVLLSFTLGYRLAMQPLMISKANTFAQITLAGLVLAQSGLAIPLGIAITYILYLTAATTAVSGGAYMVDWISAMTAAESDDRERSG